MNRAPLIGESKKRFITLLFFNLYFAKWGGVVARKCQFCRVKLDISKKKTIFAQEKLVCKDRHCSEILPKEKASNALLRVNNRLAFLI